MSYQGLDVPNAERVRIHKIPYGKGTTCPEWHGVSKDAETIAMINLTQSGLNMWLWLSRNMDNYNFTLSRAAWVNEGLPKNRYYRGRDELIEKKYLIPNGDNTYDFYEVPQL